jgi:hypothetical protein
MAKVSVGTMRSTAGAAELRAFLYCLSRSRFNVIILLAGFGLLMSDQGRDLLVYYAEERQRALFGSAALLWALSIWFWSRVLLDVRFAEPPECTACYNRWRTWMPRLLGALGFGFVGVATALVRQWGLTLAALIALVLFLAFVITRRTVSVWVAVRLSAVERRFVQAVARILDTRPIGPRSLPPFADLWQALQFPRGRLRAVHAWGPRAYIAAAMLLGFVVLCLFGNLDPVDLGRRTGAMILFFLWAVTWLPVGSVLSYWADRRGVPLLALLMTLSFVSSYSNDNHEIRPAPDDGVLPHLRPSVTQALAAWGRANTTVDGAPAPFVVVATAGGGIRAAYWTATVLGDVDHEAPRFRDRLFAVSGVSGGSVGATVYRALLALAPDQLQRRCAHGVTACAQTVLGEDLLGPLSAALLYPDLAQRFWPWPWFRDRGEAFEQGLEAAFRRTTGVDALETSLGALSRARPWPALFLNATWDDSGRRIVASNLRYATDRQPEAGVFARSNDELAILGYDLRLSTAAHNSARFPYVNPPGMWRAHGAIAGRLQDGGLFENYGAETALEILDLACRTFTCVAAPDRKANQAAAAPCAGRCIYPVVVLITSDPALPKHLAETVAESPIRYAYELRSTLQAYESVRNGRGAEAAARLEGWTNSYGHAFVQFRMCDPDSDGAQPPLGWALSEAARAKISSYLHGAAPAPSCYPHNRASENKLRGLLAW